MKPYPKELRERVVAAVEQGIHSIADVAEIFGVGVSFVKKMLKLHRDGESLKPRHGGGIEPLLNPERLEILRAAVETRPDATLEELQRFIADECQVRVSISTICRTLQKLKLPRKKRVSGPVNAARKSEKRSVKKSLRLTSEGSSL